MASLNKSTRGKSISTITRKIIKTFGRDPELLGPRLFLVYPKDYEHFDNPSYFLVVPPWLTVEVDTFTTKSCQIIKGMVSPGCEPRRKWSLQHAQMQGEALDYNSPARTFDMATCMLVATFPNLKYQDTFDTFVFYNRVDVGPEEEWSSHIIKFLQTEGLVDKTVDADQTVKVGAEFRATVARHCPKWSKLTAEPLPTCDIYGREIRGAVGPFQTK